METSARKEPWRPQLVILMALDTLRADHLGCYGSERATSPHLDTLAREGVVFENAFSQANRTLGSFASVLTGTYVLDTPPDYRVPAQQPTIASFLRAYGIHTAGSVGGGHLKRSFGFDRGFDEYFDAVDFASVHTTLPVITPWLSSFAATPRPTFIFLHGYDIHSPYHKPLFFDGLFDPEYQGIGDSVARSWLAERLVWKSTYFPDLVRNRAKADLWRARELYENGSAGVPLTDRDIEHVRSSYDGAIAYADLHVGLLLARLRALGLADKTLLIVFGDHGEQLLETGMIGHGWDLDDREMHVPLIMWGPGGLPAGRRVSRIVELLDIMPTIAEFFGVGQKPDGPGESLRPLAMGQAPDVASAGFAVAGCGEGFALRDSRYRLVIAARTPQKKEHHDYTFGDGLYEVSDRYSSKNLMARPEMAPTFSAMREKLRQRLGMPEI